MTTPTQNDLNLDEKLRDAVINKDITKVKELIELGASTFFNCIEHYDEDIVDILLSHPDTSNVPEKS